MPSNLRNSLPLVVILIMTFCGLVFADTVYLKNGEIIEKATITEITPTDIKYKIGERVVVYTIPKDDAIKIVYSDGSEDVFSVVKAEVLEYKADTITKIDTSYIAWTAGYSGLGLNTFVYVFGMKYLSGKPVFSDVEISNLFGLGSGLGLTEKGLAVSVDMLYGFPLANQSRLTFGINPRIPFSSDMDIEFITYIGYLYKQWLFNLGYSVNLNSLSLNVGYIFENIKEKKIITERKEEKPERAEKTEKSEKSSARYFRPGIELNYPVYRSSIEFFDNSFPYTAAGAGLFFRIGPEYFYFTTGVNAKLDVLNKEGFARAEFGIFGINIVSVPFLDLEWDRIFVEVPLLLSFGSGQIKFTGGALFDFYVLSEVTVNVNEKLGGQTIISVNDADKIEERFDKINLPDGNLYWVLGLDIDIVRHWGVGVKCLILGSTFSESGASDYKVDMGIEPARFQTRISTYFVF